MPGPDTRALVAAYVAEKGNAEAAARVLECSSRTVRDRLKTPEAQELLAHFTGELLEAYTVTAKREVGEVAALAFSDLPRILREAGTVEQLNALPAPARAAIVEVQSDGEGNITKLRVHPKMAALDVLGQYLDLAGLGATESDTVGSRPELGGLTIIGPTTEANTSESTRRKAIPQAKRVD